MTSEVSAAPAALRSFTAFQGARRITTGPFSEVALKAKECFDNGTNDPILVFDDSKGEMVEVDLRGSIEDIRARVATNSPPTDDEASRRPPGRPKLGVVGREVTLLPRHWDWLNTQPGGPSVTLRKLVEAAKRANFAPDQARAAREATYHFMSAMAGDYPGFEEATRVLFAKDKKRMKAFEKKVQQWPEDIRSHSIRFMEETIRLENLCEADD